ncbi:MAG: pilus assembly protein TadG-related protein [Acidimicrobiales bacterium]
MSKTIPSDNIASARGATLLITLCLLAVVALGASVIATSTHGARDRARAQTAADAAALAGAASDRDAAADFAGRNGAALRGFRRVGDRVRVEVTLGSARAAAEAEVSWQWIPIG